MDLCGVVGIIMMHNVQMLFDAGVGGAGWDRCQTS